MTDERGLSPMADSTLNDIAARQSRRDEALDEAIVSITHCEIFRDALTEYLVSDIQVDSLSADESALLPIANTVSWAARKMVMAAADYHCAQMVFAAHEALLAVDGKEA
jgi:hypothetical protein